MHFLRRMTVRRVLAVATVGLAAAGYGAACQAQDEGGAAPHSGSYQGPYLSWSGKKPADALPPSELTEARYAPAPDYAPGRYAPQSPRTDTPRQVDAPPADPATPSESPPPRYASASDAPASYAN